jgi:hypothetical protein
MSPKIADASSLRLGSNAVNSIYVGATKVWPTRDADTIAFLNASGITDTTIASALDKLVVDLKAASLWTKFYALYPFVGGSASTHKWNLKDPRDLNAAYRLVFTGSWTHSSTGARPDGSSAYADTKFNTSIGFSDTDASLGFYSRTNEGGTGVGNHYDMGSSSNTDTQATICIARYNSDRAFFTFGTSTYGSSAVSTDGRGFFVANRTGTVSEGYRNGIRIVNLTETPITYASQAIYLAANNRGGSATYFSPKEHALSFIGSKFTQQNITDFYAAVQTFQTSLGRQV